MKSRYLLIAILIGAFFLILFGVSILRVPEATAVSYEDLNFSPIMVTDSYTTYFPIILKTPVLYFDDFSDPASGWQTGDSNNITRSYQNGEYQIRIRNKSFWWGGSAAPIADISNYSVESEARLYTGSTGVYGLIFDRQDWNNFYVFAVVPSSQAYAIFRHEPNDTWINLVPFTSSTAINAGSAVNQLKVDREGAKITVYVNGQLLTTINDGTFTGTSSEVGLYAQTLNVKPIAARFDNFIVKRLPGVTITAPSQNAVISTELTGQGAGGIRLEPPR